MVDVNRVSDMYQRIMSEVSKVVIGKNDIKESMMLALLAGGHVLVEGYPGTAKTKLAKNPRIFYNIKSFEKPTRFQTMDGWQSG